MQPKKSGILEKSVIIQGNVGIGKDTHIGPNSVIRGPVVIGEECEIGPYCCIGPYTSIGSRVKVDPFSCIENSVIMDDISVGAYSRVTKSVLGEGVVLGDHTSTSVASHLMEIEGNPIKGKFGAVIGNEVVCGSFTAIDGAIIGNNATIGGGRKVSSTMAYDDDITVI